MGLALPVQQGEIFKRVESEADVLRTLRVTLRRRALARVVGDSDTVVLIVIADKGDGVVTKWDATLEGFDKKIDYGLIPLRTNAQDHVA